MREQVTNLGAFWFHLLSTLDGQRTCFSNKRKIHALSCKLGRERNANEKRKEVVPSTLYNMLLRWSVFVLFTNLPAILDEAEQDKAHRVKMQLRFIIQLLDRQML